MEVEDTPYASAQSLRNFRIVILSPELQCLVLTGNVGPAVRETYGVEKLGRHQDQVH